MVSNNILESFKGKKCFVSGGTGLIGRQIVDILVGAGAIVRVVSMDDLQLNEKVEYWLADLRDFGSCKNLTCGIDYVFAVAGVKGSPKMTKEKPASFFVPLLQMNTNILEACRLNKVEKVVYTSSIGAYSSDHLIDGVLYDAIINNLYGNTPMDSFPGWAKRMGELQLQAYKIQYGLDYSCVRLGSVYGEGDNFDPENAMVIPSLIARLANNENPLKVMGNGKAIRDFTYSKDIAEGIILALLYGTNNCFMNLGSGINYSIKQVLDIMKEFIDFDYEFIGSIDDRYNKRVLDIDRAKRTLKFNPITTLREGLEKTWNWYLENKDEHLKKQNYFR